MKSVVQGLFPGVGGIDLWTGEWGMGNGEWGGLRVMKYKI